jgi:hypothetical protein
VEAVADPHDPVLEFLKGTVVSDKRIYRYQLPVVDAPVLRLPLGAEVLSVGPPRDGGGDLDVWALVNTEAVSIRREFRVVGTGNPLPDDLGRFVGTVPLYDGALIFHVFEAVP